MTNMELFMTLGGIRAELLSGAEALQEKPCVLPKPKKKMKRAVLVAAIAALLLLLVGCGAVIAMRLQHLTIPEGTAGAPSETSFRGEKINLISIQGFMGTDSYAAFQEWQNFLSTYDPDKRILHTNNDFQAPEAYFSYGCYSQEMIDKIDEICKKYHLQPLGRPWFFDRSEDLFDVVGIESVFSEKVSSGLGSISGYCYADGTFDIEGTLELCDKWKELVSYSFRSVRKTSFDGVPRSIGDVNSYDQWSYTMADGTPVLLALRKDAGLIIVDKQDSFVTVSIDVFANGGFLGSVPQERAFLEAVCEEFDFTFQAQPVDSEKADALSQSREDQSQASEGPIDTAYLSSYGDWIDYMVEERKFRDLKYALVDADGDGVEELLLQCEHLENYNGDKNSFWGLYTIENGKIGTIVQGSLRGSNFYLCQGGFIEQTYIDGHDYFAADGTPVESVGCLEGKWYHAQGGSPGKGFGESDAVTAEEANAIIAQYPRIDIDFRPVEDFSKE